MSRDNNDLAAAIALLSLEQGVLAPESALAIIESASSSPAALVEAYLAEVSVAEILSGLVSYLPGVSFVDLSDSTNGLILDRDLVSQIGLSRLQQVEMIPMRSVSGALTVVAVDPTSPDVIDLATQYVGSGKFTLAVAPRAQILDRLTLTGQGDDIELTARASTGSAAERRGVMDWAEQLLVRAAAERASDVHIQYTSSGRLRIRFRVDGGLRIGPAAPAGREAEIIGTLMNRAGMDVANLLIPQDGTFSFQASGRRVDTRVSMIPQDNGPSMVLRLLDAATTSMRLEDLGMSPETASALRQAITAASGTIITSGPTGSGKTTTMYALLRELDPETHNILTIEDPIEIRIEGLGQTQVRHDLGDKTLGFARVLRAALRHDPDCILVGEIRDPETAETALQAAITGHVVLSTIHAPSAPSVFTRLMQMGVPRFMVAEALTCVVAQRLVRRLHGCAVSGAPTEIESEVFTRFGLTIPSQIRRPRGCEGCRGTGYLGRLVIVEVLTPNDQMREMVLHEAPLAELEQAARASGWRPLALDALEHVSAGRTSLEEVSKTVIFDDGDAVDVRGEN
jgi:type II secretory ATPase GspE/PulE/Tfp pilus assembly ATPase PilB-like protein